MPAIDTQLVPLQNCIMLLVELKIISASTPAGLAQAASATRGASAPAAISKTKNLSLNDIKSPATINVG
jgi:hypothetical protein